MVEKGSGGGSSGGGGGDGVAGVAVVCCVFPVKRTGTFSFQGVVDLAPTPTPLPCKPTCTFWLSPCFSRLRAYYVGST